MQTAGENHMFTKVWYHCPCKLRANTQFVYENSNETTIWRCNPHNLMCLNYLTVVLTDLPESCSWRAAGGEWSDGSGKTVWDQCFHWGSHGGQGLLWSQGTICLYLMLSCLTFTSSECWLVSFRELKTLWLRHLFYGLGWVLVIILITDDMTFAI